MKKGLDLFVKKLSSCLKNIVKKWKIFDAFFIGDIEYRGNIWVV